MYNYSEKRMIVFYRKKQIRILESLFDRLFENGKEPRFIGQQISDIYIEHKNSKIRILLCSIFSRMNPDELKHSIYYLRYKHYEKSIDFTADERLSIAKLILCKVDDNDGDFITCRNTLRDSISSKTSPLEVFSKGFHPH